jgi:hypothetical protein
MRISALILSCNQTGIHGFLATCLLFFSLPGLAGADQDSTPECPDFSGLYWFAGYLGYNDVCSHTSEHGFGFWSKSGFNLSTLALPTVVQNEAGSKKPPVGGYREVKLATNIKIVQEGCSLLKFVAPVRDYYSCSYSKPEDLANCPDVDWTGVIPLDSGADDTEITWSENSLSFRSRVREAEGGFGTGRGRHYLVLSLTKLDNGDVEYMFRHERGRTRRRYTDVSCVLTESEEPDTQTIDP